jgi:hypothetical protein
MGNEYVAARKMVPVAEIKAPTQNVFFFLSQSQLLIDGKIKLE